MTSTADAAGAFDLETLRRGTEERDLDAMVGLYADDAEMIIVDQRHTPSSPRVLRGRDQIRAMLSDVLGRDMTHHLDHVIATDGSVSFVERCVYPDGTRVVTSSVLDIDNGRIVKQEEVQAWDAGAPGIGYQDFNRPDEVRAFDKGRLELIRTPMGEIGRMVLTPGWRWSESVKPIAGTDLCMQTHFGYQISGRLRIKLADGTTFDVEPGQIGGVPPGHDAWVLGEEDAMLLDWAGASGYALGQPGRSTGAGT